MPDIRKCVTEADIKATYSVMKQLRPKLKEEDYLPLIKSLKETEGYCLAALFEEEICFAVIGYRIRRSLASLGNTEVYVDDFVTDSTQRSKGYGKVLFEWMKKECNSMGCQGIILDSGLQRVEAHKFYQREGMAITAYHFYRASSLEPEELPSSNNIILRKN